MKNIVFLNGQYLPYRKAHIPLATHALHYGTGCFEGLRGYWNPKQKKLYVFRLKDHYLRLQNSCRTLLMSLPADVRELTRITLKLLRENNWRQDVYIRPIVYKSSETVTQFNLRQLADGFAIYTTPLGHYLDISAGIKAVTSSWQRVSNRMIPPSAKPTGIYLNTALAKTEALGLGAEEAILLNPDGSVSEGSAENVFLVKAGRLITPAVTENILEGITRKTIIELAWKEMKIKTKERKVMKKEMFSADEIFLTGTGAEVTPVTEIDGVKIGRGQLGPVAENLQSLYFAIVRGENKKYAGWLTKV